MALYLPKALFGGSSIKGHSAGDEMCQEIEVENASHPDDSDCEIIFHVNYKHEDRAERTGSYLFTPRASRELQAVLRYKTNPADDTLTAVSYADAQQLQIDSQQLASMKSAHRLCTTCFRILNYYCIYRKTRLEYEASQADPRARKSTKKRAKKKFHTIEDGRPQFVLANSVVHHESLYFLIHGAKANGCYLCQQLLSELQRAGGEVIYHDEYQHFRPEVCWSKKSEVEGKGTLYFVVTDVRRRRIPSNWYEVFRMEMWPTDTFSSHFTFPSDAKAESPRSGQIGSSSSTARAKALAWFEQCSSNANGKHTKCNVRGEDFLPTRLLDVKQAQKNLKLRLISPTLISKGENPHESHMQDISRTVLRST